MLKNTLKFENHCLKVKCEGEKRRKIFFGTKYLRREEGLNPE